MKALFKNISSIIWKGLIVGVVVHILNVESHKTVNLPTLVVETNNTPTRFTEQELKCLADNVYHEARGEGIKGWLGVVHVTLNRVESHKFPADLCNVVYEKNDNVCQYSWVCDDRILQKKTFRNTKEYHDIELVVSIAAKVDRNFREDVTKGSHFYKKVGVQSDFFKQNLKPVVTIGSHQFYVER